MLEHADQLTSIATEIDSQASAMDATRVPGEGGVCQRANARAGARSSTLRSTAGELRELAAQLKTGAAKVKEQQRNWKLRLDQQISLLEQAAASKR